MFAALNIYVNILSCCPHVMPLPRLVHIIICGCKRVSASISRLRIERSHVNNLSYTPYRAYKIIGGRLFISPFYTCRNSNGLENSRYFSFQ